MFDFGALMQQAQQMAAPAIKQMESQAKKQKREEKGKFAHRGPEADAAYGAKAENVIKADVRMFSGCCDHQTSADVGNVASFGLPPVSAAEKAGGACTNALLSTLKQNGNDMTFGDLCTSAQALLKQRGYTQIPQLCSSHQINLNEERFNVWNPNRNGRSKALLIGINYPGQNGELSGCVNDVAMMVRYLTEQGYQTDPSRMRILVDEGDFGHGMPNGAEIMQGFQWLVEDAQPGDSLFVHYSGHGGQIPDDDGDEEDGKDECLIPHDYKSSGMLRDDDVFKMLVAPLPKDCRLTCVFDCCHSGTILDLPYMFTADEEGVALIQSGQATQLDANPGFNFDVAIQQITQAAQGLFAGNPQIAGLLKQVGGSGGVGKLLKGFM